MFLFALFVSKKNVINIRLNPQIMTVLSNVNNDLTVEHHKVNHSLVFNTGYTVQVFNVFKL